MCLHPVSEEINERDKKVIVVSEESPPSSPVRDAKTLEEKCEAWRQHVHGQDAGANEDGSKKGNNGKLLTKWGERLDPSQPVHAEYPRPAMVRGSGGSGKADDASSNNSGSSTSTTSSNDSNKGWVSLNGFWQYAVKKIEKGVAPREYDGDILVPFPIESPLSGVEKRLGKDDFLWYRRTFSLPEGYRRGGSRLILHFGAVDWQTIVYINGQAVGEHSGGYDPFEFDITRFLNFSGEAKQEVVLRVFDPTDDGIQPRGKQCSDPFTSKRVVAPLGMWYTPNSGIWQTVWLECVPKEAYIQKVRILPNIDNATVTVTAIVRQEVFKRNHGLFVKVFAGSELVGFASGSTHHPVEVKLIEGHKPLLWTPDNPFLYDVEIFLHNSIIPKGSDEPVDRVRSYTAMRKISVGTDVNGVKRLQLNNKNVFQYGILDQGWWPDGLYTPASEEALKWDIQMIKKMGFNMIRKHVKIESQRWYYHCDVMGMLVWQDMPNGSVPAVWSPGGETDYHENPLDPLFAKIFEDELLACVDALYNHPSIAVWVPFNEAWGQYSSREIVQWLEHYDKSRLVWLSGGNDFGVGAAIDRHVYPQPVMPPLDDNRVSVLGEFGGLGHAVASSEHAWTACGGQGGPGSTGASSSAGSVADSEEGSSAEEDDAYSTFVEWGYGQSDTADELSEQYLGMLDMLNRLVCSGLSAAVYTQFSDVERETNGIVTYNRKMVKLDVRLMRKAHKRLLNRAILSKSQMNLVSLLQDKATKIPKSISLMDFGIMSLS